MQPQFSKCLTIMTMISILVTLPFVIISYIDDSHFIKWIEQNCNVRNNSTYFGTFDYNGLYSLFTCNQTTMIAYSMNCTSDARDLNPYRIIDCQDTEYCAECYYDRSKYFYDAACAGDYTVFNDDFLIFLELSLTVLLAEAVSLPILLYWLYKTHKSDIALRVVGLTLSITGLLTSLCSYYISAMAFYSSVEPTNCSINYCDPPGQLSNSIYCVSIFNVIKGFFLIYISVVKTIFSWCRGVICCKMKDDIRILKALIKEHNKLIVTNLEMS